MRVMFATIVVALMLMGQAFAQRQAADPRRQLEQLQVPSEASTRCRLGDVAAYETRVHVRCELFQVYRDGASGAERRLQAYRNEIDERIVYYAVAAESPLADRIVALAVEADRNDEVTIFFRISAADNPTGCGSADCRRLTGLVLPIRH